MNEFSNLRYRMKPQSVWVVRWDENCTVDRLNAVLNMTDDDWETGPPEVGKSVVIDNGDGEVWIHSGMWAVSESGPFGRVRACTDVEFDALFERTGW